MYHIHPATPPRSAQDRTHAVIYGVITAGVPHAEAAPFAREERIFIPPHFRRPGIAAYRVAGNSMDDGTPDSIHDGEHVLVDTHDISTSYGRVYAVRTAWGEVIAKRLGLYHGRRALLSDNPDVAPIVELAEYMIIGRLYAVHEGGERFRFVR